MIITKKYKHLNKDFKKLYKLSFPKDERLPKWFLSFLIKGKHGNLIHYYDDNNFIGFTISITFDEFTCLAFFATEPKYRNQGYGKQILDNYYKENEKQIIFLNCEVPERKDNDDIKYRRLSYYKRNGFVLIPLTMTYKNIDYLTLVNKQINDEQINTLKEKLVHYGCNCKIDNSINL